MLHILTLAQPPHATTALRGMFEARKRVFVDLLGWQVPVIAGRYEVDQFDDAHCTYIVLTDPVGGHRASARLLPTARPHILADLYPHLCDTGAPRGTAIWEITRFCLQRGLASPERRRARDTLVCALADYALMHDIHAYTAIAERRWLEQVRAFGWSTRPLGPERQEGATRLAALEITIAPETPQRLREAGLIPDETLGDGPARVAA